MVSPGRFFVALLMVGLTFALVGNANAAGGGSRLSVPSVKQLLNSEYRSINVRSRARIGNRAVRMRFFMHSTRPGVKPRRPTVAFSLGCNYLGGQFRIRRGRLFVFAVGGTTRGCPRYAERADRWFIDRLGKSMIIRTHGRRLALARPAERARLVFRPIHRKRDRGWVTPTSPATVEFLDGKSYESARTIRLELGAKARLDFTEGQVGWDEETGQLLGPVMGARLDCNLSGGRYGIENGRLLWTDVVQTMMACPGSRERRLFRFLRDEPRIGFSGTRLIISKGNRQIILWRAKPTS